jgi:Bacterial Ig domain
LRLVGLAIAALLAAPATAFADAVVSNSADSGAGSLRAAVGTGGTVTFAPGLDPILLDTPLSIGAGVTITDPERDVTVGPSGSFSGGALIRFTGSSSMSGVNVNNHGAVGVSVNAGVVATIRQSPIYDVTQPIDLLGAGPSAPASLKVGPRQADGTLPLTGTVSAGGTVDAYGGDPLGATPTTWVGSGTVSNAGSFSIPLSADPPAGGKISATLTTASGGTSEWSATADVPADITAPRILAARALTDNEVVLTPNEPFVTSTVGLSDFSLTMAGKARPLTKGGILPDGSRIYLISSQPWKPGEAGSISFTQRGAVSDAAGNVSSSIAPVLVGASPGDFEPPILTKMKLKPSKICLSKSSRCKSPGTTITFTTTEPGRAVFQIYSSSNRRAGSFVKRLKTDGVQRIKWGGSLHNHKLRAGGYVMEITVTDSVGNTTDDAPYKTFKVIRTSG